MKKIISALSVFILFSNTYSSNSNSILFLKKNVAEITDTTVNCTISISSKIIYKGRELPNFTDSKVKIFGLSDSTVKIMNGDISVEIPINDIRSIKFKGKGFLKGAAIGGGIGLVLGLLTGLAFAGIDDSNDPQTGVIVESTLIVGVAFGLVGGLIGELAAGEMIYNFNKLGFQAKRSKLKFLIEKYSDR